MNSLNAEPRVVTYTYSPDCPFSSVMRIRVNGQPVLAYQTGVAAFACVSFEGRIEVEVESNQPVTEAIIRPLSRGVKLEVEGCLVRFFIERPMNLSLEIDGGQPLYFFGNPLEQAAPKPGEPGVHYFETGKIHDVGVMQLKDNETLYIEGGAVVRGCIRSQNARNVRIAGRGVLDGKAHGWEGGRPQAVMFDHCERIRVEDIVMINPASWMLVLGACRHVAVKNLKQIGEVVCSDGIDICGSSEVHVQGCFLRNNDDCVVVKALASYASGADWCGNVENVLVEECVLLNDPNGNAMEIGFELRADRVNNITFRDCDVIHVHGRGAVFSIHNGDRALVSNILYENIRVEHHWDKLFDFRVLASKYNMDAERGQIRHVRLKNIDVAISIHNPGITVSLISGHDAQHTVEDVVFENVRLNGKKVTSQDDINLHTRNASRIGFEA